MPVLSKAVVVLLCLAAAIVIYHGAISGPETEPSLQEQIDNACRKAVLMNKTYSVVLGEDPIRFETAPLRIWSHVDLTGGQGASRAARLIYTGPQTDQPLIVLEGNSYGARLQGIDLRVADPDLEGIVGIQVGGKVKNATIENCSFTHWGQDTFGLHVIGHESLTVRKCEFRCSVPLVMDGGDNHHFEDLDLGAGTAKQDLPRLYSGDVPRTCVWIRGMPNQWTWDGSQTFQGGDHAFFGRVDSPSTGQVLRIEGLRYEQSLSVSSDEHRAIDLEFLDRALERLVMVGCRWGENRRKGLKVIGCWSVQTVGSFLHGTTWSSQNP